MTLFIVPIEPIETRYTKHWYKFFPDIFREALPEVDVVQIEVPYEPTKNDEGGFFNFTKTCEYKSSQAAEIARLFSNDTIKSGDVILVTDYWNPQVIHTINYCASLSGKNIRTAGICHAGNWDPHDMLHKSFKKSRQSGYIKREESALDSAYDVLFFATKFAEELYDENTIRCISSARRVVSGFPMSYYDKVEQPVKTQKRNLIVFPHRIAEEKHPEAFDILAELLPDFECVKTIEVTETKEEYHNLLAQSRYAVSFADQETLGISMSIEALTYGVFPIVPAKLSYNEMFSESFKYCSFTDMRFNAESVAKMVRELETLDREVLDRLISSELDNIKDRFFTGKPMFDELKDLALGIKNG